MRSAPKFAVLALLGLSHSPVFATPTPKAPSLEGLDHSVIGWMVPVLETLGDAPSQRDLLRQRIQGQPAQALLTEGQFMFTSAQGLSARGRELARWVEQASFHGVQVAWPQEASLWQGETKAADSVRVNAELALAELSLGLVAALVPRPRTETVLKDDRGRYLGPEVMMQTAPAPLEGAALESFARDVKDKGLSWAFGTRLPAHPQYQALVQAAERYQAWCAEGGFQSLTMPKKGLKDEAFAEALRLRLAQEGLVAEPNLEGLTAALKTYRDSRQLSGKELVDKKLMEQLNVTCDERLDTLKRNIRRWRYSAWQGEPYRVEVNLAGQTFRLYRDQALVRQERTVVGSDKHFVAKRSQRTIYPNASPILTDQIETVVVNPEWNVPKRIARDEIEVQAAKDPTYLERNNFQIIEIGSTRFYRQGSGAGNALGRIKILFPNPESVYLHDTPNRKAFNLPVRALSHGCVRLQNAVEVGTDLIRYDRERSQEAFSPERIQWLIKNTTKQTAYTIAYPVPVFLEYYTASVDMAGQVHFHPDIYGYDKPPQLEVAED